MKKSLFFLFLVILSLPVLSQKRVLIEDKDQIHQQAISEIELAMAPTEGSIYLFAQDWGIKGEYTYDITIREKGDVATVFSQGNDKGTIENQNRLKDFMMTFEFNFKMPKGKYYKFRYTFKFE